VTDYDYCGVRPPRPTRSGQSCIQQAGHSGQHRTWDFRWDEVCAHDWAAMKNPFNDNGKSERLEECVHCHEIREAS
jgi:hypothetical protein